VATTDSVLPHTFDTAWLNKVLLARRGFVDESARAGGELRHALGAYAEQGGDIADRETSCNQFGGNFASTGGSRGSDLVSLAA